MRLSDVDVVILVPRATDLFLMHDQIQFTFRPLGTVGPFVTDIASFSMQSLGSNSVLL